MTDYRVEFLHAAADELADLDRAPAQRILRKLKWLAEHFESLTPEPLGGGLEGLFKLRAGSYRAIYSFDRQERIIIVHLVGHRSDIYRSSQPE
ncbi:MAG: type II toxin-antitoxin system RelE/ParE family toxin [bacterium]|nr:type II toxin-antitoxin system RelE/ParE family toxin [bacterium]